MADIASATSHQRCSRYRGIKRSRSGINRRDAHLVSIRHESRGLNNRLWQWASLDCPDNRVESIHNTLRFGPQCFGVSPPDGIYVE